MSALSILRKVGAIAGLAAPEVISAVNPPMGALAGAVLQSILLAEARNGAGAGVAKKQQALAAVQVALPLIVQAIEARTGKRVADEAALTSGFDKLNDGMVDLLNAFGVLPKNA